MQKDVFPIKWITDQVAIGCAPRSYVDIDAIKASGIGAVLNLCAECYDLHEIEYAAGLDVHWLPVTDENAPELNDASDAIDWMA
ncbi:MAG: protein phosphatase, partial [Desulfosarcina sp.]